MLLKTIINSQQQNANANMNTLPDAVCVKQSNISNFIFFTSHPK